MSSMWLNVTSRSFPCAWNFGDASFTLSVTEDTPAVIVLSQLDSRYFSEISGYHKWSVDFVIYRKGAPADEPYTRSTHHELWRRSVNVELDNLEAGDYVVHVRLDRDKTREKTYYKESADKWNQRKLSKVWTEACLSKSIAVNFNPDAYGDFVPASVETYGGEDLTSLELTHYEKSQTKLPRAPAVAAPLAEAPVGADASEVKSPKINDEPEVKEGKSSEEAGSESGSAVIINTENKDEKGKEDIGVPSSGPLSASRTLGVSSDLNSENKKEKKDEKDDKGENKEKENSKGDEDSGKKGNKPDDKGDSKAKEVSDKKDLDGAVHDGFTCDECRCMDANKHDTTHQMLCVRNPVDANKLRDDVAEGEDNAITLGLKVYTKGKAVATVAGQLRHGKVVGWRKRTTTASPEIVAPSNAEDLD
ncbi:hypothetical protein FRC07_003926 [Ceratobasidium sp. 392]|nr:hypothetical protein FRC07_003926 [Ceratobasidium sp. 392]